MSEVFDANVAIDCSVILGGKVLCDGYVDECDAAVITHAHGDHYWGLEKLMLTCENIYMSLATKELLIALKGDFLSVKRTIKPLEYDSEVRVGRYKMKLFPAQHILGASQVVIQDVDTSRRIAYTGDFLMPGTVPVQADTLVIDATYGNPSKVRDYTREDVESRVIARVKELTKNGKVVIDATRGKMQEVMNILRQGGVDVPFVCSSEMRNWARIYDNFGSAIGDCESFHEAGGIKLLRSSRPHVLFRGLGTLRPEISGYTRIKLSGKDSVGGFVQLAPKYFVGPLSDHADFNGTMDYIRESKPTLVITDNSRGGDARDLATEVRRQLKIRAVALPRDTEMDSPTVEVETSATD